MIMSWFTQPPGGNASYYQYDTVTQQFSRTRLELGRQSESRSNDTFVTYKAQRSVGFSSQRYSTTDPASHWSVDADGALCYDQRPLREMPSVGDKVYDSSNTDTFVHRGNAVTDSPTLPPGIAPKHLALLANEAILSQADIPLTAGDATQQELVAAIESRVCAIVGVDNFTEVTDQLILDTLTQQVRDIQYRATGDERVNLEDALAEAEAANHTVNEQIEDGILTPTAEFETAFEQLQASVVQAQVATGGADVQLALDGVMQAQQALDSALQNIDTAQHEATARQLDASREALVEAQQSAVEWQAVEAEYDVLTEAESLEVYEEEIGIGVEEFA